MIADVQFAMNITPLIDEDLGPFGYNHNHRIRKCPFSQLPFRRRQQLDSRTAWSLTATPLGEILPIQTQAEFNFVVCSPEQTNKQTKLTNLNKTNVFFFPPVHTLESFIAD